MKFSIAIMLLQLAAVAQPGAGVAAQREAMKKLAFLEGKWAGPATVNRGPRGALQVTQHETVEFRLDGLVLLVEGRGDSEGTTQFRALATIAYDPETSTYRFRAYNDGRYLDTELTVTEKGFQWGYAAGPLKVTNTMSLTGAGEWQETTVSVYGSNPPMKAVEMKLAREK